MFSRVFDVVNTFLFNVSPYYIPVTSSVFRSDYIQFSSKISDYMPIMSDMWVSIVLNSQKIYATPVLSIMPVQTPVLF